MYWNERQYNYPVGMGRNRTVTLDVLKLKLCRCCRFTSVNRTVTLDVLK